MKNHHFALLLLASFLLAACSSLPDRPHAELTPASTTLLSEALLSSKPCEAPSVARQRVDPAFKYGCFCGKHHPSISHHSGRDVGVLTPQERSELIARFYAIKPIDDIDAACQAHDVCWIHNGQPERACNDAFRARLKKLQRTWESRIGWFDTHLVEWRCAYIALDMSFATLAIMEGTSSDSASEVGLKLARFFSAPITVIYAGMTTIGGLFENYPARGELCLES